MDDLISRQAALDALNGGFTVTGRENAEVIMDFLNGVCKKLRDLPSAERRGRWIYKEAYKDAHFGYFVCSLCGEAYWKPSANYCPNCGARMEGEEE